MYLSLYDSLTSLLLQLTVRSRIRSTTSVSDLHSAGHYTAHQFVTVCMFLSMLMKFFAVVIYTPTFIIPSTLIAAAGGYLGNIYLRAQLSVKREMSNAKAPVIGILGGAISGLRE